MKMTPEQITADGRLIDIGDLPSMMYPYKNPDGTYEFEKVFARKFQFAELSLISMAASTGDASHIVRAVNNVISVDVNRLTIADFYYILMWLKSTNYPKTPYTAVWTCEAPVFYKKNQSNAVGESLEFLTYAEDSQWPEQSVIDADYEMKECGTKNTSLIHMSDIEIRFLNHDENDVLLPEEKHVVLPEGMDYPRVLHYTSITQALADPGLAYLVGALQWIKGSTWQEILRRAENDQSNELVSSGMALNSMVDYGVRETVEVRCRHCRAKRRERLTVEPASFFQ